jgi:NAD(P)-dependent dehydrogenase (short-subunit alcohol dehydrogenase family)
MPEKTKSVLITGTNSGIGRAAAEHLSSRGFHVYAGARDDDALEQLSGIPNVTPVRLDVTVAENIARVQEIIREKGTGLFGLVNNAGITKVGPLMDLDTENLREQFEVNFFGIHEVTRAFFPLLLKAQGRIVMISSDSGFFATPFVGPYCSSKFALEGYSDSLRREISPHGVKVILIQPGRIATPIWDKTEKTIDPEKLGKSMFRDEALALAEYSIRKGKSEGLPPKAVAETIYNALTLSNPKLRYIVAKNSLEYKLIKILPAQWVDRMVSNKIKSMKKPSK